MSDQNPASEPKPNSTGEATRPKKSRDEKLRKLFPDSYREPSLGAKSIQGKLNKTGYIRVKLGVTDLDVRGVPSITRRVKEAVGSIEDAVRILEGDDSAESMKFIEKWNLLTPTDRREVHLEDVVIAAGLTTRRFMELLAGASMDYSATVSKIIVSEAQPKVLRATVKAATDEVPILNADGEVVGTTSGDVKAQEMFHKMTGALPTPKGAQVTLNQQFNSNSQPDEPRAQTPLQSMDSFLLELDDIRKPKQLKAPVAPQIPVEMPQGAPEIEYLSPLDEDF